MIKTEEIIINDESTFGEYLINFLLTMLCNTSMNINVSIGRSGARTFNAVRR